MFILKINFFRPLLQNFLTSVKLKYLKPSRSFEWIEAHCELGPFRRSQLESWLSVKPTASSVTSRHSLFSFLRSCNCSLASIFYCHGCDVSDCVSSGHPGPIRVDRSIGVAQGWVGHCAWRSTLIGWRESSPSLPPSSSTPSNVSCNLLITVSINALSFLFRIPSRNNTSPHSGYFFSEQLHRICDNCQHRTSMNSWKQPRLLNYSTDCFQFRNWPNSCHLVKTISIPSSWQRLWQNKWSEANLELLKVRSYILTFLLNACSVGVLSALQFLLSYPVTRSLSCCMRFAVIYV